jgi:hypothetical protein
MTKFAFNEIISEALRGDFTVPGNFTPPVSQSELSNMFQLPTIAFSSPRHRDRMGADDYREPRQVTAEQIRGVE